MICKPCGGSGSVYRLGPFTFKWRGLWQKLLSYERRATCRQCNGWGWLEPFPPVLAVWHECPACLSDVRTITTPALLYERIAKLQQAARHRVGLSRDMEELFTTALHECKIMMHPDEFAAIAPTIAAQRSDS
jgi:hypothetical protein